MDRCGQIAADDPQVRQAPSLLPIAGSTRARPKARQPPSAVFEAMQHINRVFAALASLQILAMPLGIAVVCTYVERVEIMFPGG